MGSGQDLQELLLAFCYYDKNGDGRICANDIRTVNRLLGLSTPEGHIDAFLRKKASDGKGFNQEEFMAWMQRPRQQADTADLLRTAFSILDKNNDGFINRSELSQGLTFLGTHVSDNVLKIMLEYADADRDGRLSYTDFTQVLVN